MIFGLAGAARSGKDTAAAHLIAAHGYERRAFADPMRDALYALNPNVHVRGRTTRLATLVDVIGWDRAKAEPDVRGLLQRFGTEVGRTMWGDDFWIDQALAGVEPGVRVVLTDVRFPNEADAVRNLGGLVVRIERPGAGLDGGTAAHSSEAGVDADLVIANDQDLAHLHRQIDRLMHPAGRAA